MSASDERREGISDIVKQFTTKPLGRRDLLIKGMAAGVGVMGLNLVEDQPPPLR